VTSDAAGGLNVEAPLAVNPWVTVNSPLFVVVTPVLPRLKAEALVVPMFTTPLAVAPVPASIETFPPFAVPAPEALPPSKLNVPPVPVVLPV
jgi:hypothetical protein